jgi:hypothetical protein
VPFAKVFRTPDGDLEDSLRRVGHFDGGVQVGDVSMMTKAFALGLDRVVILGFADATSLLRPLRHSSSPTTSADPPTASRHYGPDRSTMTTATPEKSRADPRRQYPCLSASGGQISGSTPRAVRANSCHEEIGVLSGVPTGA